MKKHANIADYLSALARKAALAPRPPEQIEPRHPLNACLLPLLRYSETELAAADIAETNLIAALDLPGSENLDIASCLRTLDAWADRVRWNTDHYWRLFKKSPEQFRHSEGQYRMMMLATVLQQDVGVHYDVASRDAVYDATDSRTQFIHGPLLGHGGTCASLPVLYAAVGRRLGYPLALARAYSHLFLRWEAKCGERFNIESSKTGYGSFDDEYYTQWPKSLNSGELRGGYFLRSLTPREELAEFLTERACCLVDILELLSALECLDYARWIDPKHPYLDHRRTTTRLMLEIVNLANEIGVEKFNGGMALPLARNPLERELTGWAVEDLQRISSLPYHMRRNGVPPKQSPAVMLHNVCCVGMDFAVARRYKPLSAKET